MPGSQQTKDSQLGLGQAGQHHVTGAWAALCPSRILTKGTQILCSQQAAELQLPYSVLGLKMV